MTGWLLCSIPGLLHLGGDRGGGHACPRVSRPSQGAMLPSVMAKLMGELMGATLLPLLLYALQKSVLLLMHHLQSRCKYGTTCNLFLSHMPHLHLVCLIKIQATVGMW